MPAAIDNTDIPERNQWLVYWAHTGQVDTQGKPIWGAPEQVACRWSDETVEFVDMSGAKQASKAVVYPDRDLVVGSYVRLGRLADTPELADPEAPENDAQLVKSWKKVPDWDAEFFLRKAFL
jgi:hypothetical protein